MGAIELTVVGGGKMGTALIAGLMGSANGRFVTTIVEPDPERRRALEGILKGVEIVASTPQDSRIDSDSAGNSGGSGGSGASGGVPEAMAIPGVLKVGILAVKPKDAEAASIGLRGYDLVVSIMAGIGTGRLQSFLGDDTAVVRAMPNTPALVGSGVSAIAAGSTATEEHMAVAEELLGAVGTVVRVPESALDAVTGLSGSGPAYIFLVVEALVEAGVTAGLPHDVSTALAIGTLVGSAKLLAESGMSPEQLRADVTSPGGTTAAGLRKLEERSVRSAFIEAVMSAAERSGQLGS